jgi:hypothetical protein
MSEFGADRAAKLRVLYELIDHHHNGAAIARMWLAQLELPGCDQEATLRNLEWITEEMERTNDLIVRLERDLGITIAPGSGGSRPN